MQTLLGLGDAPTGGHEDAVEEIRMAVMQLASDLGQRPSEEGAEGLFLAGRHVTEDADVLREDVLARPQDGHGRLGVGG